MTTKLTYVVNPKVVNLFTYGYSFNTIDNLPRGGQRPAGLTIPEAYPENRFGLIPAQRRNNRCRWKGLRPAAAATAAIC